MTEIHGKNITIGIVDFKFLKRNQTLSAYLYSQQLQRVHENLQRKRLALVNRRNDVLFYDNARPRFARITQEKHRFKAGLFCFIHHIHQNVHQVIFIFFVLYKML